MSTSLITVVVPHADKESIFLLHAVEAALRAYRQNRRMTDDGKEDFVEHDEECQVRLRNSY